jgi:hypothetical protein
MKKDITKKEEEISGGLKATVSELKIGEFIPMLGEV